MLPLLLPLLLPSPTHAQDLVPVLISGFQGQDAASVPVAMRLPELLEQALADQDDLDLLRLERVPDVHDQTATVYMDACPDGQIVGCSFVVGEGAGAAFALTGTVKLHGKAPLTLDDAKPPPPPELLVELQILDIEQVEEALTIELVYTADTERSFADTLPDMLHDVVEGWVGQVVDIRVFEPDTEPEDAVTREEAARDLTDLEGELGEVEGNRTRGNLTTAPRRDERPKLDHKALLAQYEGKRNPWDERDLTSREYLAWWNSGWDYNSWSRRFDGRKGQLMARIHGGWGLNPTHGLYWGRTAFDEQAYAQESYAAQETVLGGGLQLGLGVGYGITPAIEIELGVAREGGQYQADIRQQDASGGLTDRRVEAYPQGLLHAWAGVRVVPAPTSPLRPILGVGAGYWMGKDVTAHTDIPLADLPEYPAPHILSIRGLAGTELRLSERLDLIVQAPLHLLLSGTSPQVYDEDRGVLLEGHQPGSGPVLAGGLQVAVQARM